MITVFFEIYYRFCSKITGFALKLQVLGKTITGLGKIRLKWRSRVLRPVLTVALHLVPLNL